MCTRCIQMIVLAFVTWGEANISLQMLCAGPSPLSDCTDAKCMLWTQHHHPEAHTGKPRINLWTEEKSQQTVELSVMVRGRRTSSDQRQALFNKDASWPLLEKSSFYLCFKSFLDEISKLGDCMHDYSRLCKLAYLADILAHLNNLHSSREGSLS